MRLIALLFLMLTAVTGKASTYSSLHFPPLTIPADTLPAVLLTGTSPVTAGFCVMTEATLPVPDKNAVTVGKDIVPYKFMDDMTFVGVPLFVAGLIAKSEKKSFRQDYEHTAAKNRLIKYNFHNEIDNYTQFAPLALATGLKIGGVEGRSDWGRYLASGAMAYAIMAGIVNPIKYSAKEMRPDGSTRNSFPSGHTATAFVSATILHKEYGLTRSPWYSVAGYGVATATGVMRVLNNRHWVSDVLAGAGIGILSTELAYGLSDIIFKEKGLVRTDRLNTADIIENPSFFSLSMGIGLGSKSLDFDGDALDIDDDVHLKFQTSTVVGAEGAYFFNKYVGVGGRLRVRSTPIKGWDVMQSAANRDLDEVMEMFSYDNDLASMIVSKEVTIESDHITEFAGDVGVYFNLPLSRRFALGSKLLIGRSIIQDLDIDGHVSGHVMDCYDSNGNKISALETGMGTVDLRPGDVYDTKWNFFTLSGNNTMKYGTGISLTYTYKSSFSWRVFADYDFTRKTYTMTYNPDAYISQSFPLLWTAVRKDFPDAGDPTEQTIKKNMNNFVIGGAFCVSF